MSIEIGFDFPLDPHIGSGLEADVRHFLPQHTASFISIAVFLY